MTRMSHLSSPLFLGFEEMERLIDRVGKGGDGYPPYNIERVAAVGGEQRQSGGGDAAYHAGGCGLQAPSDRDHDRGQPAQHPRPAGRRQIAAIHSPRHRHAPVQPHIRAGRRHRGEVGGSERRAVVHRSGAARAGACRAQDRDRPSASLRLETSAPQLGARESPEDTRPNGRCGWRPGATAEPQGRQTSPELRRSERRGKERSRSRSCRFLP